MHKLTITILAALFLGISTALPAQDVLFGGFVESADLFMYLDIDNMYSAPIVKKMEAMTPEEMKGENDAKQAKILEATGLAENDLDNIVISMDMDKVDFEQPEKVDFNTLPAILAVEVKKPVTLDQLVAGIKVMIEEEDAAGDVQITQETREGVAIISMKPTTPEEDAPDEIVLTISENGKVILGSFNFKSVADGLSRIQTQKTAPPTNEMAGAIRAMQKQQIRMAFVFPPAVQNQVAAMAQADPTAAMFATMKGVMFNANATDSIAFGIKLDMGNPQSAMQLNQMAGMMLPGMIAQGGAMMPPETVQILQKIKVSANQSFFNVDLDLTEADMKSIVDTVMGMMMMQMMDGAEF